MTKLEEKLLHLGYKEFPHPYYNMIFGKRYKGLKLMIATNSCGEYSFQAYIELESERIIIYDDMSSKKRPNLNVIDKLQEAFNILKQDLEALKEYENIKTNN